MSTFNDLTLFSDYQVDSSTPVVLLDFVANLYAEEVDYSVDQLSVALSDTLPSDETDDPTVLGNNVLSNVTQISYTNVSSLDITTTSWTPSTNILLLEDLVISASGGDAASFRYIYIYNDDNPNDAIVGYFDLGESVTLKEHETLTLDFDSSNGLFEGSTSLIPNQTVSRSISSLIKTALSSDKAEVFWLTELEFDSPNQIYMWSGLGDFVFDGKTYTGVGSLLSVSELRESSDIAAYGATLTLSGIPSELISLAISEPYQGRSAIVKFGIKSGLTNSIATVYSGNMDQMNIQYGPDSVTISLDVESRLVDLQRPRIRRYTDADQKSVYLNDDAFEFVTRLQNESLEWTAPAP